MRRFRCTQVDVFTSRPLTGNPLCVVFDAAGLTTAEMQAVARETNLSETTFVLAADPERNEIAFRIFTPAEELPFAGHPVVGTLFAAAAAGLLHVGPNRAEVRYRVPRGTFPARFLYKPRDFEASDPQVFMTQAPPEFGLVLDDTARREVGEALGLEPGGTPGVEGGPGVPPQVVGTGLPHLMFPLTGARSLAELQPDPRRLARLARDLGFNGVYTFTPPRPAEQASSPVAVQARFFGPGIGVQEDPATGSAAGPLAAYLYRRGLLPGGSLLIHQGEFLHRASRIHVRLEDGPAGLRVEVGGAVVEVMRGEFMLPEEDGGD